jgi:hypothetical protein
MKVEGKKKMDIDNLCCDCLDETGITLGECENLYHEYGFATVLNNGIITEFIEVSK